jgi:hypothetical protein
MVHPEQTAFTCHGPHDVLAAGAHETVFCGFYIGFVFIYSMAIRFLIATYSRLNQAQTKD